MALRIVRKSRYTGRYVSLSGQLAGYMKYENDIYHGRVECPYKVCFKDADGSVITTTPIPLKPNGEPKIRIYDTTGQ